jgi:hypothetical protein
LESRSLPGRLIEREEVAVQHRDLMRFAGQDLREGIGRERVDVEIRSATDGNLPAGGAVVGALRDIPIDRHSAAPHDRPVRVDFVVPRPNQHEGPRTRPDAATATDIDEYATRGRRGNPRLLPWCGIERRLVLDTLRADLLDVEIDGSFTRRNRGL